MNYKIYSIKLSLFWKFAIAFTFTTVLLGIINISLLYNTVYSSFENEINKRITILSSLVSERLAAPVMYDDVVNIYNILEEIKRTDISIAYIFVISPEGIIIAETFERKIPHNLLDANDIRGNMPNIITISAKNFSSKTIRDIAYPIMDGKAGVVRMGVIEENIGKEIKSATQKMLIMLFSLLSIGLIIAFIFSYLITSPIKYISEQFQKIDLNSIADTDFKVVQTKFKQVFLFYLRDELDVLVEKFIEMSLRLKQKYIHLKETRDFLIQSEKMASLGTLTAGIAHEINNPISGIKNCITRIEKNPTNIEQNLKYFGLIKEAANAIENTVSRILQYSRKQEISFTGLNISDVLFGSVAMATFKLQKNNIFLNMQIENDLYIKGSFIHLEQIFLNLLLNAADAITEKMKKIDYLEPEIIIKSYKTNEKILIGIKDNGIGILPETKSKIFDPFFTTKEVGKGTGLGLYVCYNIIKLHNGNIICNSDQNGTEFIVEFSKN